MMTGIASYLLPTPKRSKTIKESNILKQIRVQPQSGRDSEHSNREENESEDSHDEEQSNEAEHAHTEIPDTETKFHGPEREHDDCEYQS